VADCYLKINRKDAALEVLKGFGKQGVKSPAITDMISRLESA